MGYSDSTMKQMEMKRYPGMYITICAIESCMDIPDGMAVEEISEGTPADEHLSALAELVLPGWPSTETEVQKEL